MAEEWKEELAQLAESVGVLFSANDDDMTQVYVAIGKILSNRPEMAESVFNIYDRVVQSDKNDADSLQSAYTRLGFAAKRQPILEDGVLRVFDKAVQSRKNDELSLEAAYGVLNTMVMRIEHEKAAKRAYRSYNDDKETAEIARNPDFYERVLQVVGKGLRNEENHGASLETAYKALKHVVEAQPALAEKVLQMVGGEVQKDVNTWESIEAAYDALSKAVDAQPALAGEAVKMVLESLPESMHASEVRSAYMCINKLLEEKEMPNFNSYEPDEEIINAYKVTAFVDYEEDDMTEDELAEAKQRQEEAKRKQEEAIRKQEEAIRKQEEKYKTSEQKRLESVSADLVKDVFKLFYVDNFNSCGRFREENPYFKFELVKRLGQIPEVTPKMAEVFIKEGSPDHPEALHILALCQKKARSDDFANLPPEWGTISKALAKMRFSTEKEIDFVCENWNAERIAKMSFSAQQRVMNVLVSELGKEQGLAVEELKKFRKGNNAEVEKMVAGNSDWLVSASFKAVEMFGCYFPNYLKKAQKAGLSTHDAVYWLPENMGKAKNESFSQFIRNNILYQANGKEYARPLGELSVIAHNWKTLTPEQEKMRYKDVLAVCMSKKYDNHKYDAFAMEAAKFGYSEYDYPNVEKIYQAGLSVPEPFDSSKRFEIISESGTKYVGRFLPREDPRVGFFGNYTDCCQRFGGVGKACAVSSVKDPYSQLFVIEDDKERIIAGSWVWENTEGKYRDVCFDNIEAIGDYARHPVINEIYDKVGKYLTQEANCRHVTIGQSYPDADTSAYAPAKEPIPLPTQYHNGYSDANSQVILAHNPDAKPLDKEKESRRFIRDVCFLDVNAMDKVAEECFPESDQELMTPENMAGKVLVDSEKGVVGYCLWDEAEKSVYDMAVLPEYRKDKNASSTKLFLSVQQEIRKIGGEWTAELRDKTTYHYMKMMQARGLVKMDTLEVDHEMSDGSKVYQVRFTPLEKKRGARQQENAAENNEARSDEASGQESQGKRFSDVQMAVAARQGRNAG